MFRSATQRLGSGPRNLLGSVGSRTHSNHTVERSSRSPRGCHAPRALGGCLTTSTLQPRCCSTTPCQLPCIPDLPTDAQSEGTLRLSAPTPEAPLHDLVDPLSAPWL